MFGRKTKQVKEVRDLQKQSLETCKDDYMIGLYNGLEFALSILEGREPSFLFCVSEEIPLVETEERVGRTVASGKRVIRK